MSDDRLRVNLRLEAGDDADAREIDRLTLELRRRLLELPVDAVDPVSGGAAPPGTRAGEVIALGALLMTLAKSPEVLKIAVGTVQSWLGARQGKSIEMEIGGDKIKLSGLSSEEQRRLVDLFVERHAR